MRVIRALCLIALTALLALMPGCCLMQGTTEEDAQRYHPELDQVTEVALAYARGHQPLLDIIGEIQRIARNDAFGLLGFRAGRDDHWQPLWHVMFFAEGSRGALHGTVFVRQREGAYVAVGIDLRLDGGAASFGETPELTHPDSDGHGGGSGGGD